MSRECGIDTRPAPIASGGPVNTFLAAHRKTIIAAVGAAIVILSRHFGATSSLVLDLEVIASAAGVYAVPNG